MSIDNPSLKELQSCLSIYINLPEVTLNLDQLKYQLKLYIHDLLSNNYEGLLNFMYLIDVNEDAFNLALNEKDQQKLSEILTELVIERLLQKVYTRIEYRSKTKD